MKNKDRLYKELCKIDSKMDELNEKLNLLSRRNLDTEKYCFVIFPGDGLAILDLETDTAMPINYKTKKILEIENQEEFDKFFLENKCC